MTRTEGPHCPSEQVSSQHSVNWWIPCIPTPAHRHTYTHRQSYIYAHTCMCACRHTHKIWGTRPVMYHNASTVQVYQRELSLHMTTIHCSLKWHKRKPTQHVRTHWEALQNTRLFLKVQAFSAYGHCSLKLAYVRESIYHQHEQEPTEKIPLQNTRLFLGVRTYVQLWLQWPFPCPMHDVGTQDRGKGQILVFGDVGKHDHWEVSCLGEKPYHKEHKPSCYGRTAQTEEPHCLSV